MSETPDNMPAAVAEPLTQPAAPVRSRRRRERWLVALLILLAGGGWFGHFAYLRITLRPEPRPEYWEARLAELDPPPPGAISASEAYDLLTHRPFEGPYPTTSDLGAGSWRTLAVLALEGEWHPSDRPGLRLVDSVFRSPAFERSRTALLAAVRVGWQDQITLNSEEISGVPVEEYTTWIYWLLAHSRWARMELHDNELAAEDWLTCLQLDRQLRRLRLGHLGYGVLVAHEMIIAAHEGTGIRDLHRFARDVLNTLGTLPRPAELVKGVYILNRWQIDRLFVRRGRGWLHVTTASDLTQGTNPPSPLWNLTSPLFNDYLVVRAKLEAAFSILEACGESDCYVRLCNVTSPPPEEGAFMLDGIYWDQDAPALLVCAHYRTRSELEAAMASLAVAEYRRIHGRYPDRLEDVAPSLLPHVPIDYACHKPLRYRRSGDTYVLYSIGPDGIDDGGTDPDLEDIVYSSYERESESQ